MNILDKMEIVREIDHLCSRLRKNLNIPLRQPVIDFCFGGKKSYIINDPQFINLCFQCCNVYKFDNIEFYNRDWYYGLDTVVPDNGFEIEGDEDLWVGINILMPEWLKKIGDDRLEERKRIMAKKIKKKNNAPKIYE